MTRPDWQHALGMVSLDEAIDLVRKEIYAGCSRSPTRFMSRKGATKRLEEDACIAIAYAYSQLNPDRTYIVHKGWPRAFAIIAKTEDGSGYEAIIEPWLGHDDITNVDGIEPVRVPVEWGKQPAGVLNRIRSLLPWKHKLADPPLELKQPAARQPTRVIDRDLAPTGYPEGLTRKPAPATPQAPAKTHHAPVKPAAPRRPEPPRRKT